MPFVTSYRAESIFQHTVQKWGLRASLVSHLALSTTAWELCVCVLPLQDEDDLAAGLVDLVQRHHEGVGLGHLQHGDLVQDVHTAVLALPPLSQTLGGVLLPRDLLHALLHHGKLSPGSRQREKKTQSEPHCDFLRMKI